MNGHIITILIDTSSSASLMCEDCYHRIRAPSLINQLINFRTIGSRANEKRKHEMPIDNDLYEVIFHIVPNSYKL